MCYYYVIFVDLTYCLMFSLTLLGGGGWVGLCLLVGWFVVWGWVLGLGLFVVCWCLTCTCCLFKWLLMVFCLHSCLFGFVDLV